MLATGDMVQQHRTRPAGGNSVSSGDINSPRASSSAINSGGRNASALATPSGTDESVLGSRSPSIFLDLTGLIGPAAKPARREGKHSQRLAQRPPTSTSTTSSSQTIRARHLRRVRMLSRHACFHATCLIRLAPVRQLTVSLVDSPDC